jgi:hypothetical protein
MLQIQVSLLQNNFFYVLINPVIIAQYLLGLVFKF